MISTGEIKEDINAFSEIVRFLRHKAAPIPSALISKMEGVTPDRREATWLKLLTGMMLPISFQSADEIFNEYGAKGIALMIPEITGFPVGVYGDEEPQELDFGRLISELRTPKIEESVTLQERRKAQEEIQKAMMQLQRSGRPQLLIPRRK